MLINFLFITIIVAAFVFGYIKLKQKKDVDYFPSLLSSIGVLGTFVGIIIGLWNFDTSDISASITTLLDGLKTAFITSIVGMASSMIFTVMEKKVKADQENETLSRREQAELFVQNNIKQTELLQQIEQALNREDKTPELLQQIKQALDREDKTPELLQQIKQVLDREDKTPELLQQIKQVLDREDKTSELLQQIKQVLDREDKTSELLQNINTTLEKNKSEIFYVIRSSNEQIKDELVDGGTQLDIIISALQDIISFNREDKTPELLQNINTTLENRPDKQQLIIDTIIKSDGNRRYLLDEMQLNIDNLAKEIRENNINALVGVMQKVTEEFSSQMTTIINRLVKENFDQLNTSVERLNTWQQENKDMLQDMTNKYHTMQQSFEKTSTTLADVRNKTVELTKDGGKLSAMIENLQKAIVTDNNLDRLTASLKESVLSIESATSKYKKTTENVNSWIKSVVELQANIEVLTAQISEIDVNRSLQKISNEYYAQLSNTLQALDNCLVAIINKARR